MPGLRFNPAALSATSWNHSFAGIEPVPADTLPIFRQKNISSTLNKKHYL
jgi:hypothetical protein